MQTSRPTWEEYFFSIAELVATRSTCRSSSVGAVIVKDRQILGTGFNGVPKGLPHCIEIGQCYNGSAECINSPFPSAAVHAEMNAIAQCSKKGVSTEDAEIYVTHEPCLNCLKLIIASGIKTVYFQKPSVNFDKLKASFLRCELINYIHQG